MKHHNKKTNKQRKRKKTWKNLSLNFFEKVWTWKNLELQAPIPRSTQGRGGEGGGTNLKSMNQNDDETKNI